MFRRAPSRGGRGHRAAVDFVVCFGCGRISCFLFRVFLRTSNAHDLFQVRGRLASFISLLVILIPYSDTSCYGGVPGAATNTAVNEVPTAILLVMEAFLVPLLVPRYLNTLSEKSLQRKQGGYGTSRALYLPPSKSNIN